MSEVHADPDKLRELAKRLIASAEQMQQVGRSLGRALETSGWEDSERRKFETDFKQTLRAISQFSEKLKTQYVPVLQKKAAALDEFRKH